MNFEMYLKFIELVVLLSSMVAGVLFVIAEWRILTKAGEKGWKSLIPVYNVYVSHHIVGMSHIWFVLEIITWIIEFVLESARGIPDSVGFVFGLITAAVTFVSEIIHINRMCNCFGKGIGFKIGMYIVPQLFIMIIAYGKAQYNPPRHK